MVKRIEVKWYDKKMPIYRFTELVITNPHYFKWNEIYHPPYAWGRRMLSSIMKYLLSSEDINEVKTVKEHFTFFNEMTNVNDYYENENNYKLLYDFIKHISDVLCFTKDEHNLLDQMYKYLGSLFQEMLIFEPYWDVTSDSCYLEPTINKTMLSVDSYLFEDTRVDCNGFTYLPFGTNTFLKIIMNIYKKYQFLEDKSKYNRINKEYEKFANKLVSSRLSSHHKVYNNVEVWIKKGESKEIDQVIMNGSEIIFIEHKSQVILDCKDHLIKLKNTYSASNDKSEEWLKKIKENKTFKAKFKDGGDLKTLDVKEFSSIINVFTSLQNFKCEDMFTFPIIPLDRLDFTLKLFDKNFGLLFNKVYCNYFEKFSSTTSYTDKDFFTAVFELFFGYKISHLGSLKVHLDFWDYDTCYITNLIITWGYDSKYLRFVNDLSSNGFSIPIYYSSDPIKTLKEWPKDLGDHVEECRSEIMKIKGEEMWSILSFIIRIRVVADKAIAKDIFEWYKKVFGNENVGKFKRLYNT